MSSTPSLVVSSTRCRSRDLTLGGVPPPCRRRPPGGAPVISMGYNAVTPTAAGRDSTRVSSSRCANHRHQWRCRLRPHPRRVSWRRIAACRSPESRATRVRRHGILVRPRRTASSRRKAARSVAFRHVAGGAARGRASDFDELQYGAATGCGTKFNQGEFVESRRLGSSGTVVVSW
jgi:hypothetical protein